MGKPGAALRRLQYAADSGEPDVGLVLAYVAELERFVAQASDHSNVCGQVWSSKYNTHNCAAAALTGGKKGGG